MHRKYEFSDPHWTLRTPKKYWVLLPLWRRRGEGGTGSLYGAGVGPFLINWRELPSAITVGIL